MDDFLTVLKSEHKSILRLLDDIYVSDIYSGHGQMKLSELKRLLEVHLRDENEKFYPRLRKAADTDAVLRRELFLFAADMDNITAAVAEFFKEQEKDPPVKNLLEGFGKIAARLKSRIDREENLLIKEYEKLQLEPPAAGTLEA